MYMTIREAVSKDYDQIIPLLNAFVEEDRYSKRENDSFHKILESPTQCIFIAEEEERLVGFATVSIRHVLRYAKPIAELDELFVGVAFQHKGIGKKLLQTVEKKAEELECYRIYVESAHTREKSYTFYESQGYERHGVYFLKNL